MVSTQRLFFFHKGNLTVCRGQGINTVPIGQKQHKSQCATVQHFEMQQTLTRPLLVVQYRKKLSTIDELAC